MALPPTGSRVQELLVIDTDLFTLSVKGIPFNPYASALDLNNYKSSHFSFVDYCNQKYNVKVFDSSYPNSLKPYNHGEVFPLFFEQTNYEIILEVKKEQKNYSIRHDNPYLDDVVTPTGKSGRVYSGVINFQNEVGFSRFIVTENDKTIFSFEIEVFPSKLDYIDDFHKMLQEINQEVYNLAYDFIRKTYLATKVSNENLPSEAEFFTIISTIFDGFYTALKRIENHPNHKIVPLNRLVRPEKAKKTNKETIKWLRKNPEKMQQSPKNGIYVDGTPYVPRKVMDSKKELSYDTNENRLLKWILFTVDKRLKRFADKLKEEKLEVKDEIIDKITNMRTKIRCFINHSFLQNVGRINRLETSSLVMQMAPGYREVYKYYLMMLKGLHISSDVFELSLKDVAQLYEYWCFLKLNSILRNKYNLEYNNLVSIDRSGITVRLKKGKASQLKYRNPRSDEEFLVTYNRAFNRLPTIGQHPDNILTLYKNDSNVRYQYIFDAKYRIDASKEYINSYNQIGPPVDTINTMHRYRDAIVAEKSKETTYYRDIFGAFILFPHNDEESFAGLNGEKPSKFYESISEISIGALPFLPSQTKLVEKFLDDLVLETSDTAFERSVIQEGTKRYYSRPQINDVLIGSLRRASQLEVCLNNNMYYTYLDLVKNQLGLLRYVALYQSKRKFPDQKDQGIVYYGKIKEYYILSRKEIKEAEKSSYPDSLAVKFVVDEWKRLKEPIIPRGYGPQGPQFTSWQLFKEAKSYPELHLTWEEMRLLKELRRIEGQGEVRFPKEDISLKDKFNLIEFPGLIIERKDENKFKIITDSFQKSYYFGDLKYQTKRLLKEIIGIWNQERK